MQPDLDAVTARILGGAADAVDPLVIRFLLWRYTATAREDLSEIVGAALARALTAHAGAAPADGVEWLLLFAEALAWSDDERLTAAAGSLLAGLDAAPPSPSAIEACLRAAAALGDRARTAARVDDLERIVRSAYEPGEGVGGRDEFGVASALLTAYEITGRLPYPMLAEELVQSACRRGGPADDLAAACAAARVFCRLQALHGDEAYVRAAVIAPHAEYGANAARLLARHGPGALETARGAAAYGLALAQWLGLH